MKMYEITEDIRAIQDLFDSAVDDEGNPRDLTEEEKLFLQECQAESTEDFEAKFDSMGKLLANFKILSDTADSEKKALKSEMDRLSARAKSYSNRRDSLKSYLMFNMKNLGIEKYKTALFSAGLQQTPVSIKTIAILSNIPEEYLKPREVDSSKIKDAIKTGKIKVVDGDLFLDGVQLEGIKAERSETLVIR